MNDSPYTLGDRTLEFFRGVLRFCEGIKVTVITRPLIDQLVRSATSIGANYAEANNAASKQDFRNKIYIAKKETAETKYWLTLLSSYTADTQTVGRLAQECQYFKRLPIHCVNSQRKMYGKR